jgi:hypothetical protein
MVWHFSANNANRHKIPLLDIANLGIYRVDFKDASDILESLRALRPLSNFLSSDPRIEAIRNHS